MLRIYVIALSGNIPLNIHLPINNNIHRNYVTSEIFTISHSEHYITVLSHAESSAIKYKNPVEYSHVGYHQIFYAF